MSIATALTGAVDSCTIGVKPKTDAAAMPRTETRISFSRPTTTSPPADDQSVRTKSPSLVKDSEVSRDLAKLISTRNDPSPLPSTYATTATLSTTSPPGDCAIEDDSESLEEFKDNGDTYEPKLEAFPRIKPTWARPISLISKLIRDNTPHDIGSGDGSEKTRTGQTSGNTTEQGPRTVLSQVDAAAREAKDDGRRLDAQILHYKSITQLSKRCCCPDQEHETFAPEMHGNGW
ncbi:hypothetical protein CDV31_016980 [Fusarium ambrosium]|uniref:Uncharacterized protein n=1 Tax=Fusarium ambrosium TaxID=131363 RepID=A0A428RWS5_9HYPO|nr:hypothetical protein CDV31_016980 [Fusarium ambrosium]